MMQLDFAFILFSLVSLSGAMWMADHFYFRKKRSPDSKEPLWVEWGATFFPVLLLVFVLRSFIFEPFRIPSGSMIPTLLPGDFILVNKYTYGLRLPVLNRKIISVNKPQRGDVMVFRYPVNPAQDYIKRVIALPGDEIAYENKRLSINGVRVPVQRIADYLHPERLYYSEQYYEKLNNYGHNILNDSGSSGNIYNPQLLAGPRGTLPQGKNCAYSDKGLTCKVPKGHYFVMGDNRDNSRDSRFWGFVPDENIVGKAFYIWMHIESFIPPRGFDVGRVGSFN